MATSEPLGNVRLKLGLDTSSFGSELDRTKQELKYATSAMKGDLASLGKSASVFDKLSTKQRGLTDVMKAQQKTVNALGKSYENSFMKNGQAGRSTAKLATQFENERAKLNRLNQEYIANAKAMAKARVQSQGFTGSINKASTILTTAGGKLSSAGNKMTAGFTVPVVAGLGSAIKMAIDFDSQITQMGPLLTNGGKVTKAFKTQLDELGASSKKWAAEYGVSTTIINDGMTELIKRGFTAQQTLGAMPSILDATKASGEEMGVVMQTSASIMEQFGLKGKTVAETMKNTQRVTDSVTYAANATAAGFSDMGAAMAYVGPVADSLGMSVESVAATVGVLSNMGIEGEAAGTNLRGILTALVNPSAQAAKALEKMGISAKRAKEDASDLPTLIDDISKGTKTWTKEDKAQALSQIFGRRNQAAMNALLKAGSGELRTLTKETKAASGATKEVAAQMNQTKANQIKREIENIKQLGISIGQDLLPLVGPTLEGVHDVVNAFSKLDKGTQQNIIKWIALGAAVGPVMKIFGGAGTIIGGLGHKVIDLAGDFKAWKAGRVADSAKRLNTVLHATEATATTSTASLGSMAQGMLYAGKGAGALGTALTPVGLGIAATVVAAGAGYVAWKAFGEQAYNSSERTKRWGADVGESADGALSKVSNFQGKASSYMATWNTDTARSAKGIQSSFSGMTKAAKDYASEIKKSHTESLKGLDSSVQTVISPRYAKEDSQNYNYVAVAKQAEAAVTAITKKASKERRELTTSEKEFIVNAEKTSGEQVVNMLHLSADKHKKVIASMNADIGDMSKKQLADQEKNLQDTFSQLTDHQMEQSKKLGELFNKGLISSSERDKGLAQIGKDFDSSMKPVLAKAYELQKALGNITKDGKISATAKEYFATLGANVDQVKKAFNETSKAAKSLNESLYAKGTNKASQTWNFDFLYDAEKGIVRTKDQLKDFLAQSIKTEDGWNKIKLVSKSAKLGVDGATVLNKAIADAGKWNQLTMKEQKALINAEYGKGVYDVLQYWVDNKTLPAKTFEMLAKGDPTPILEMTKDLDLWNSLPTTEKQLLVKNKATVTVLDAIAGTTKWNNLSVNQKELIMNAKGLPELGMSIVKLGLWNQLDPEAKNLVANNTDFMAKLNDAAIKGHDFSAVQILKEITGNDQPLQTVISKYADGTVLGQGTVDVTANTQKASSDIQNVINGPAGIFKDTHIVNVGANTKDANNKIKDTTGKANKLDGKKMKLTGSANMHGANEKIKNVSSSWQTLLDKPKSKTFTTYFNTVNTVTTKRKKVARGTSYFGGGPALVNDQPGSSFRELVQYPNGTLFIPHGRNVPIDNLPRGSKVFNARQTKQLIPGIRQFASGNVPASADILQIPKKFNDQAASVQPSDNLLLLSLMNLISEKADKVINAVDQNSNITISVNVDGAKVSKKLGPEMAKVIKEIEKKKLRRGGILDV